MHVVPGSKLILATHLNMTYICYIPVRIQSDDDFCTTKLASLARGFQIFMNTTFVDTKKINNQGFTVDVKPGEGRLHHYIVLQPQLHRSINHLELIATFCDVIHLHCEKEDTCPFLGSGLEVEWGILTKKNTETFGRMGHGIIGRETKFMYKARMRLARKQHVLASMDDMLVAVAGPPQRIMNCGRGGMLAFGGQMVRYWQRTCNYCTKGSSRLCPQHRHKMAQMVNACDCYSNVWTQLYMQESRSLQPMATGSKIRDILRSLDLLCTTIDHRQHIVENNKLSAYLPVWTAGRLVPSAMAVDVLFTKYKESKDRAKGLNVVIGGPLGAGKSWVWKTLLLNLARERARLPAGGSDTMVVVVVVPRISLCAAIASDLRELLYGEAMEVVVYNETAGTQSFTGSRYGKRVVYVTVVNSIEKLGFLCVDIIIVDEIETVTGNLCGPLMNRVETNKAFDALHEMISDASLTMCMEGTMSRATPPLFIKNISSALILRLAPRRSERQTLVLCTAQTNIFPTDEDKPDPDDFFTILCAVAASPASKVAVCVGSIRTAHSLRMLLRYNTDRSVLLVSEEGDGDACEQFTKCSQYDVTILTPVVSVGISEATCTFTHVFTYVQISPHTMGLPHYIQMMARMRLVKYPHSYVAFSRPYGYPIDSSHLPINLKLAMVQWGRELLSAQWMASGSTMTRDFIRMWAPNYTSCLPGTTSEQEPCVIPYSYSLIENQVSVAPTSVRRPSIRERTRCRAKLRKILKTHSTCIASVRDVDIIHRGACIHIDHASCLMRELKDSFSFVQETRCLHGQRRVASQGFFRPLLAIANHSIEDSEMAESHEHKALVATHLPTPFTPHAIDTEAVYEWTECNSP